MSEKAEGGMAQFEYSDFYKFAVSLGIALILAAILLPWLFFREPFDLMVETNQLALLTPLARETILRRQVVVLFVLPLIPWISAILLTAGISLSVLGLSKWRGRQELRDRTEELTLEKLRKELSNMSADQVRERAAAEVHEVPTAALESPELKSSASHLLNIEQRFYDRIRECLGNSYRVLVNQILGSAEFDAILQSSNSDNADITIEVKYIRHGFKFGWLRESVMRLAVASDLYNGRFTRRVLPVLIVILAVGDAPWNVELEQLRQRVRQSLIQRGVEVRVEYVHESAISIISCEELKALLLG